MTLLRCSVFFYSCVIF